MVIPSDRLSLHCSLLLLLKYYSYSASHLPRIQDRCCCLLLLLCCSSITHIQPHICHEYKIAAAAACCCSSVVEVLLIFNHTCHLYMIAVCCCCCLLLPLLLKYHSYSTTRLPRIQDRCVLLMLPVMLLHLLKYHSTTLATNCLLYTSDAADD